MKLTGTKRKGQHLQKNVGEPVRDGILAFVSSESEIVGNDDSLASGTKTRKKPRSKRKLLAVLLCLIAFASLSVYLYVRTALSTRPPVKLEPRPERYQLDETIELAPQTPGDGDLALAAPIYNRDPTQYTFLLLATDAEGGNTDVIMVVSFDTSNGTLNAISIPRDTLVNVSWSLKKANSIYSNMRQRHGWEEKSLNDGMHATVETFADLLGFEVDYWVLVDMRAFVALVDAIDGVEFDVPVNMNYVDEAGGLSIQYSRGLQRLSGRQALEVLRYRAGYSGQDIGRISTQQDFLMSAARQILAKKNSLSVNDLANIILRYVKTDIDLSSLIWFANQFLKINADAIEFDIMPGFYQDNVGNQSYVTIYIEEWLELVNEKLNPYVESVTAESVSILTRGSDRYLYVTDGNRRGDASWGAYSTGSVSSGSSGSPAADTSASGSSGTGSSTTTVPAPPVDPVPQQSDSEDETQIEPDEDYEPQDIADDNPEYADSDADADDDIDIDFESIPNQDYDSEYDSQPTDYSDEAVDESYYESYGNEYNDYYEDESAYETPLQDYPDDDYSNSTETEATGDSYTQSYEPEPLSVETYYDN